MIIASAPLFTPTTNYALISQKNANSVAISLSKHNSMTRLLSLSKVKSAPAHWVCSKTANSTLTRTLLEGEPWLTPLMW